MLLISHILIVFRWLHVLYFTQSLSRRQHVLMKPHYLLSSSALHVNNEIIIFLVCFLAVGWGHFQPCQVAERRLHGGSEGGGVRLLHLQRRGPDPDGRPQPVPLLRPAETLRHRHGQVWLQVRWWANTVADLKAHVSAWIYLSEPWRLLRLQPIWM